MTIAVSLLTASPAYAYWKPSGLDASQRKTRGIIIEEAKKAHYSESQVNLLLRLGWKESRFHRKSHSRSNCHGVFQLSRKMAHGHPWKDARWNTRRALRYIKGRYGSVNAAWSHSRRKGWY